MKLLSLSLLTALFTISAVQAQTADSSAPAAQPVPDANTQPAAPAAAPSAEPSASSTEPSAAPAQAASAAPAASASPQPAMEAVRAQPVSSRELVTRLQIFLDEQNFGPGIIDGRWGEFTGKALVHYARAHDLQVTPAIYNQLPLDSVYPIYVQYTITPQDEKTVGEVPSKPPEEAKMKRMPYPSLLIFMEERYHVSPDFLAKINRGLNLDKLKAGDVVRVPNVAPFKIEDLKEHKLPDNPAFANRTVYVSTKDKMLDLYDDKKLIASFPITPGSKTLPAPPGVWEIIGAYTMPEFRWDEAMLEHGKRSSDFYEIPPGPRNPVGILWAGLDKIGIGIHGTSSPETIGRAASHGCIRLANWDAAKFSTMITKGMTVTIQ